MMLRGTFSRLVTAVAATASGGETMAPRTNAAAQGRPRRWWATRPMTAVVRITSRTASIVIGRRLA